MFGKCFAALTSLSGIYSLQISARITEPPELKGSHKDHQSPIPGPAENCSQIHVPAGDIFPELLNHFSFLQSPPVTSQKYNKIHHNESQKLLCCFFFFKFFLPQMFEWLLLSKNIFPLVVFFPGWKSFLIMNFLHHSPCVSVGS